MKTLTASNVRIPPDTFNRVAYQRERVRIDRRGAPSVAIVSIEDLELLEFLDRLDVQPAKDSLVKLKALGEEAASLASAKTGRG
jgi:PHD/YefM family antitoxin component YafN of YafNO toxin-antitoxin module